MKLQVLLVLVTLCSGMAARIKLRHHEVTLNSDEQSSEQQQRQERRLEDPRRFYNIGYVEYKSENVDNQKPVDDRQVDEDIDEYVVIEAKKGSADEDVNVAGEEDDRYEEVDNHYDDDDLSSEIVPPGSSSRGLVPQLWPNYTGPALPPPETVSCNEARLKCAYRAGCGLALQNYVLGCSDLVKGSASSCNSHCRHALIALMSTPEGQRLMKCNCSGDAICEASKERVEPCQAEVTYATQPETIVSCSSAQWICAADPLCSTALDYYNRFCGAMFAGKRCTPRCRNSIEILRRQAAATKLESCYCDGTEPFNCHTIKKNMASLCFGPDPNDNEIDTEGDKKSSKSSASSFKARIQRVLLMLSLLVSILAALVGGSVSALFQLGGDQADSAAT